MSELIEKAAALLKAEGYTVEKIDNEKKIKEISKMTNRAERRKAIADNIDLFNKK